jgi:ribonuclease BN (tRNA processing enzyme)
MPQLYDLRHPFELRLPYNEVPLPPPSQQPARPTRPSAARPFPLLRTFQALILGTAAAAGGSQSTTAQPEGSRTELVLLGTGTPNAEPARSGPAVAVVVDDSPYLVDFGPGVVRRAAAAFERGVKGLDVKLLRTAFATHLHSDHTAGYPDLILTPAVLERDAPLDVYGPPGLRAMTDHVLAAWHEDVRVRLEGLEPAKPAGYEVRAHEVLPGEVYRDARVTVRAFAVTHGSWERAYGYRFETKDRTIVVSGDCTPSESVVLACDGCDILVHEVYSVEGFSRRPPEWQRYHRASHTSAQELGDLATRARPKLLVLYHQLQWGVSDDELVAEVRSRYAGTVVYGRDLDVF